MTVTRLGWQEALAAVKVVRPCAGPNLGFQRQLQEFEATQADQVREDLQRRDNCKNGSTVSVWHFVKFIPVFLQFREWLQMEYKDNPFNDEADVRDLLVKVSKVNGEDVKKQESTPTGGI